MTHAEKATEKATEKIVLSKCCDSESFTAIIQQAIDEECAEVLKDRDLIAGAKFRCESTIKAQSQQITELTAENEKLVEALEDITMHKGDKMSKINGVIHRCLCGNTPEEVKYTGTFHQDYGYYKKVSCACGRSGPHGVNDYQAIRDWNKMMKPVTQQPKTEDG